MDYNEQYPDVNVLVGKVLVACYQTTGGRWSGGDEIHFIADDGTKYKLYHSQDCCESVGIEDLNGNLSDLVGSPITLSDEVSNNDFVAEPNEDRWSDDVEQWTFYKFATLKGYVDVRWYGTSNGYYSTGVDFMRYE